MFDFETIGFGSEDKIIEVAFQSFQINGDYLLLEGGIIILS